MDSFIAVTDKSPYKDIHDSNVVTIDVPLAIAIVGCLVTIGGVVWAGLSLAWKLSEIKNQLFGMSNKISDKLLNVEEKVNSGLQKIDLDLQKSEKELGNLDARITMLETYLTKHGDNFTPARTRR